MTVETARDNRASRAIGGRRQCRFDGSA